MQTTNPNHNQPHPPSASSASAVSADKLPGIRHIIAVGSGKGGVGKSTVSVNDVRDLRLSCHCALCVEEMSGRKLLDPKTIRSDVSPRQIVSIGNYAIKFDWSDGHNSGIYSFNDLRALGARAAAKSVENV